MDLALTNPISINAVSATMVFSTDANRSLVPLASSLSSSLSTQTYLQHVYW